MIGRGATSELWIDVEKCLWSPILGTIKFSGKFCTLRNWWQTERARTPEDGRLIDGFRVPSGRWRQRAESQTIGKDNEKAYRHGNREL